MALPERHVTEKGREFLKRREGLRLQMYSDSAGFPTIGWGHVVKADDEIGVVITIAEAEQLLTEDLAVAERSVCRYVSVPLEDHQFDALCSWTYNLGGHNLKRSTLLRLLNAGEYDAVPVQMLRWVYAGDQDGDGDVDHDDAIAGLRNRREMEGRLFATGDYGF